MLGKIRTVCLQLLSADAYTTAATALLDSLGLTESGANNGLSTTLTAGNTTGGTDIDIQDDYLSADGGGVTSDALMVSNGGMLVYASDGTVASPDGKNLDIVAGGAYGDNDAGGSVRLLPGTTVSGTQGSVEIKCGGTNNAFLYVAADGVLDVNASAGNAGGDGTLKLQSLKSGARYGSTLNILSAGELLSDLSSDATTATLAPAGSTILGVTCRVKTAVVTSSATNTFSIGEDGGDADRFGAGIAGAQNTTTASTDYTADPRLWNVAAHGSIKLTPPGAETFSSGAVYVVVHYMSATGPTSTP